MNQLTTSLAENFFQRQLIQYGPDSPLRNWSVEEAFSYCRKFTRSHYENFNVASWLLPVAVREHFYPIYAYCRWADDLADLTDNSENAMTLLSWWESQLDECYLGRAHHPVFVALTKTIDRFGIPKKLFADLLRAFRQDQLVRTYSTRDELLDYCRCSANPVGRLVLYLAETTDQESFRLSDGICTSLQLANHWQDIARDKRRVTEEGFRLGRRYVPWTDMERFNYSEADFENEVYNTQFAQLMEDLCNWAQVGFTEGRPLVERVPRSFRTDIRLFIFGGEAVLKSIRRINGNVWRTRPKNGKFAKARLLLKALWG